MSEQNEHVLVDLTQTDWAQLREQKLTLVKTIWDDDSSPLWGIVHFLDYIQDEAAKDLSEEAVFGILDES